MALSPSGRWIVNPPGANQLLPQGASHFMPVTERSNRVQDGALSLINVTSPLGSPTKANPAGAQKN